MFLSSKSSIFSFLQFLWCNLYIKIHNKVVCYKDFAGKKMNYVRNIFDKNWELKSWKKMLNYFQLTQISYFKWFQLIHAIPKSLKVAVLNDKGNCKNIYLNHHLIKNNQVLATGNFTPKKLFFYLPFWKVNFLNKFPY